MLFLGILREALKNQHFQVFKKSHILSHISPKILEKPQHFLVYYGIFQRALKSRKPLKFQAKTPQSLRLRGFCFGPSGGIYAGVPAPAEASRAPFSVALDRSLLERPPDVLTTLAPSRVQIPL